MIQRIQTVYLLLGSLLLIGLLVFSGGWQEAVGQAGAWMPTAVYLLGGLAAAAGLGAIFLYSNRQRQRRVVVGVQVLTVLAALIFYWGIYTSGGMDVRAAGSLQVGRVIMLLLPIAAYVFFFLARRGITKDIKLVRSMDRLR